MSRTLLYEKTTAPTEGDDVNDGYEVGDNWLDTTNDLLYILLDKTAGAAIWVLASVPEDGWFYFTATITRSSNTVFTFPGTAAFAAWLKGKGLKWTDTTTKRGIVTNATESSGTVTVTLAGSTLAASATLTTMQFTPFVKEIIAVLCVVGTDLAVGDDAISIPVPLVMDGWYVHWVSAFAKTAPVGAAISIQLPNNNNDMLSTALTIDAGENSSDTAATPPVISETYWQVTYGQGLDADVDVVGSSTAGDGVSVSWLVCPP